MDAVRAATTWLHAISGWMPAILYALATLVALEVVHLVLRRVAPRLRLRTLFHLWAIAVAFLAAILLAPNPDAITVYRQLVLATSGLLTALVLFNLLDGLVFERPWDVARGPMIPKLARDVIQLGILLAVGLLMIKDVYHVNLSAILVSSTILSAVIGLALQDTLRNVFAGVSLDVEKPFERGDWLLIDGTTPAQVLEMSWRSTHLRTKEGVDVYEPNSTISTQRLVNYGSGRWPIALVFRVGLGYDAPPDEVKAALLAAVSTAEGGLSQPAPRVFTDSYGESSITYRMRVWTRDVANLSDFQDSVYSRIWYQLQRRGLIVPFPIRTIHFHSAEERRAALDERANREATNLFAGLDLFAGLEPSVVETLATAARRERYGNGEALVREHETGDSLFVIRRGHVVITKDDPAGGKPIELARMGEGAFFGEMSLLTGEPRSATVRADGACEVLVLGREDLAPVLQSDPKIAETLSASVAARQAEASKTVEASRGRRSQAQAQAERSILSKVRAFFKLP